MHTYVISTPPKIIVSCIFTSAYCPFQFSRALPWTSQARGIKSGLLSALDTELCHQGLLTFPGSLLTFLWDVRLHMELFTLLQPHRELLCFCAFAHDVPITEKTVSLFQANLCSSFKIPCQHHCHQETSLTSSCWTKAYAWAPTSLHSPFSYNVLVTLYSNSLARCLIPPSDCNGPQRKLEPGRENSL